MRFPLVGWVVLVGMTGCSAAASSPDPRGEVGTGQSALDDGGRGSSGAPFSGDGGLADAAASCDPSPVTYAASDACTPSGETAWCGVPGTMYSCLEVGGAPAMPMGAGACRLVERVVYGGKPYTITLCDTMTCPRSSEYDSQCASSGKPHAVACIGGIYWSEAPSAPAGCAESRPDLGYDSQLGIGPIYCCP